MTDHERYRELAGPYALDALEAEQRAPFEAHLAECATCRADVQAFREVAGALAHAAPAATPPPGLRDRVLREARQVRPLGAARTPRFPWIAAAASIALAIVAGYGYWRGRTERDGLRGAIATMQAQLDSADRVVATILDSTVGTADLAATGKAPTMRLYWNRVRGLVVVAAFDLPPAPSGRIYQLWAIKKGQNPVSVGTFNTAAGGRAIVTLPAPAGRTYQLWAIATGKPPVSLGTFNTAPDGRLTAAMAAPPGLALFQVTAVTEEPAGGSPQPTQQPFLIGKLAGGD